MNIVFHYLKQKVHVKHKMVRALTENLIYVLQSKHIAKPIRNERCQRTKSNQFIYYFTLQ